MIKVKIISSVEIPLITEEMLQALIKKEILSSNPELNITDISFKSRINPTRIEATVEANLATGAVAPVVTEEVVEAKEEEPVVESTDPFADEVVETEPTEKVETVNDIFGED